VTAAPLPALYLARTPRLVRRVAAVLFAALFATPALLLFVPWQQTVRGKGQVVAFTPLDRRQTVEAPVDGRLVAWAVQESTEVAAGDPLVEISDNDPRMAAAVEEAVSRWPEFVDAYRNRSEEDSDRFIVKAEFREGKQCEYMWVTVSSIDDDGVRGTLMNDPHELLDIHRGAEVHFELDRLNDWIYPDRDEEHVGGFTLDVLAESEGED